MTEVVHQNIMVDATENFVVHCNKPVVNEMYKGTCCRVLLHDLSKLERIHRGLEIAKKSSKDKAS